MNFREFTLADYEGVTNCQVRNQLSSRPREGWEQWLADHPCKSKLEGIPIGWVLENESGEIVGSNTNVPMAFEFNSRFLRVANASSWAVDEEYRNHSLKLGMAWMRQRNADLLIDMSAIEAVAKLLHACKFQPLPVSWYTHTLIWITNYPQFIGAVIKKKEWQIPSILKHPIAWLAYIADKLRGRNKQKISTDTEFSVEECQEFDVEFDQFWRQLRQQRDRLLLLRDARSLRWRHQSMLEQGKARVIKLRNHNAMVGYLILWEFRRPHLGLNGYQVADLQVLNDDADGIKTLINTAISKTRQKSFHVLEATGFHQDKRSVFEQYHPHKLPPYTMPYYFKTSDPELRELLAKTECWDPTISDGF